MTLGDIINSARVDKRMGLRALARELDIAPSYLSDIENNRRVPSEVVLRDMARVLDLDFDRLMQQAGRLGEDAERYLRQKPPSWSTISENRSVTTGPICVGEVGGLGDRTGSDGI